MFILPFYKGFWQSGSKKTVTKRETMNYYPISSRFIHSLVFSLRGRVGRNQSSVMWPVWLWHTACWASSWG